MPATPPRRPACTRPRSPGPRFRQRRAQAASRASPTRRQRLRTGRLARPGRPVEPPPSLRRQPEGESTLRSAERRLHVYSSKGGRSSSWSFPLWGVRCSWSCSVTKSHAWNKWNDLRVPVGRGMSAEAPGLRRESAEQLSAPTRRALPLYGSQPLLETLKPLPLLRSGRGPQHPARLHLSFEPKPEFAVLDGAAGLRPPAASLPRVNPQRRPATEVVAAGVQRRRLTRRQASEELDRTLEFEPIRCGSPGTPRPFDNSAVRSRSPPPKRHVRQGTGS